MSEALVTTCYLPTQKTLMNVKRLYLQAMGIPLWLPRQALGMPVAQTLPPARPSPLPLSAESDITDAWEVEGVWELVDDLVGLEDELEPEPIPTLASALSRAQRIAGLEWDALLAEARQCRACGLCEMRTQVVFGVGKQNADWLVIGEAPGADEDQQGEPFVGRAGKLLNPMLLAIGLQREQVYITNIVRCRPPENRDPTLDEAAQCRPFLQRQIALIQPRIILAVGRVAAQNLLETSTPIGKLRGQVHRFGDAQIPVVVTYHPAYLLRSPREKRKAWDDLRLARQTLLLSGTGSGATQP